MTKTAKPPVSFHIFNRPELTRQVFDQIRQYRPDVLFVTADGPREGNLKDQEACKATRAIVDEVDWRCEVVKNFSDVNLGSYKRNFSGISWLFDNVEEAIILEDDCVPHPTFFQFCEELLPRYRHDTRIGIISGDNFLPTTFQGRYSYYFSRYILTWGWASWRRTWQLVDPEMKTWPEFRANGLSDVLPDHRMRTYWDRIFQAIWEGKRKRAWDYQLLLTCFSQNMISVIPDVNLVTNIGFGSSGTNCTDPHSPLSNIQQYAMQFPLTHPQIIVSNSAADRKIHSSHFDPSLIRNIHFGVSRRLNRLLLRK